MTSLHGPYDLGIESVVDERGRTTISLFSNEDDPHQLHVTEVYGELVQRNDLKGIAKKYSIVNLYYLLIEERARSGRSEYWVNLAYLTEKPRRRLYIAWIWLAAVPLIASIAAAAYLYLPVSRIPHQLTVLSGILTGCALSAAVSLYFFVRRSRYRHVYLSRTGRLPFVELLPSRPDRKKYRRFRELLQQHIQLASNKWVNPGNALAKELREHRRLHQSGIIDDGQYHRAKDLILKAHSGLPR